MKNTLLAAIMLIFALAAGAAVMAQEPANLRFLCMQAGNECETYADLLARFTQQNPEVSVSVDVVAEDEFVARWQAAADAGAVYDIARVNAPGPAGGYLELRPLLGETLTDSFRPAYFEALRGSADDDGLYGYPDALGVVAPFVNTSLFEQAGVALPADDASWDDWLAALEQVLAATDASYALAVDNKDHRLVGPALSLGAQYFDEDGKLTLPDAGGLRAFLQILYGLMATGKTPDDTLLGTGKSQDYFVRGETVMYICGSWKVEEVAAQVGDDFAWTIVPNPAGAAGGAGVAQATWLAASAETNHQDAVAQVFAFLLDAEVSAEFAARTLTVPAREDLAAGAIDYQTDDNRVAAALNAFAREASKLQDQAIALDSHPLASAYYQASNANLRAYFAGELGLDDALGNLRSALEGANAAAANS